MRTIAVFVLVGMFGMFVHWLGMKDQANFNVKTAAILGNLLGGALLGIGFGLTGYCPGTGLACAVAGRIDAMITVLGMLAGALVFILTYPWIGAPVDKVWNLGKPRLPGYTGIPYWVWIIVLVGGGVLLLALTARREKVKLM